MVIDGKKIAAEILERLAALPKPNKFLGAVLIEGDTASASFQNIKKKTAEKLGVDYRIYTFPEAISSDTLREEVGKIAAHRTCGGVIVQLPLPKSINAQYVLNAIPREKDPDVLGERALGAFYAGRNTVLPPAVATVEEILKHESFDLKYRKVAVVGRGFLVGKPVAVWLMDKCREVIVSGRGTDFSKLKDVDLMILGAGRARLVNPEMLKLHAAVIDFGYAEDPETGRKLAGDFDASQDSENLAFYTPTPGGTGPILVAKLFENFYMLNRQK